MSNESVMTTDEGPAVPRPGSVISEEEAAALLERKEAKPGEVRPLDLAKLRITHGRLPMLEVLHQSFITLYRTALSALVKRDVQVSLQKIETQKCADYFAALESPANLDLVNIKPLKGTALFVIDPALLYQVVEAYYGGNGRSAARETQRALTPAAQRLGQMLLKQMFADLKKAWAVVAQLEFEGARHESNPQFVHIANPGDGLLVNRFFVELPGGGGTIDFVMPEAMFEPLREALRNPGGAPKNDGSANWSTAFREHLRDAVVEVRGVLAETRLSLRELVSLKPGDVLPIDPPGAAVLCVDMVPVFSATFGISGERNALKLTGPTPASPRKG